MKCGSCTKENPDGMRFCGHCGKPLQDGVLAAKPADLRRCVSCGRVIPWDVNVCQHCGHDYRIRR